MTTNCRYFLALAMSSFKSYVVVVKGGSKSDVGPHLELALVRTMATSVWTGETWSVTSLMSPGIGWCLALCMYHDVRARKNHGQCLPGEERATCNNRFTRGTECAYVRWRANARLTYVQLTTTKQSPTKVHVIEVSDLKGKDSSGTSDPIVHASCLGTTKHTRVRKGVNSAVFDEVLYFNLPNLSRYKETNKLVYMLEIVPLHYRYSGWGSQQQAEARALSSAYRIFVWSRLQMIRHSFSSFPCC